MRLTTRRTGGSASCQRKRVNSDFTLLSAPGAVVSVDSSGKARNRNRSGAVADSVGGAQLAFETAKSHLETRHQFGRALKENQALQFRLADMATELEAGRLMVRAAAAALDARDPNATKLCAMAKRYATDAAFEVANQALQLHGGYGYLKDFPLERIVRDLRVHQILEGTNEIMRVIIARELLRQ